MKLDEQLDAALKTERPMTCLRELLRDLIAQGEEREFLLGELENYRHVLRKAGRDADEDIILEVMDFLVGFCGPGMEI
ncbi:MAG TPA: hypothetical protein VLG46_08515 [Anaerolineae bacterium]|nr:hypothetical protein [Anaerolineae bacterium]